jgi:hypothetical protein
MKLSLSDTTITSPELIVFTFLYFINNQALLQRRTQHTADGLTPKFGAFTITSTVMACNSHGMNELGLVYFINGNQNLKTYLQFTFPFVILNANK